MITIDVDYGNETPAPINLTGKRYKLRTIAVRRYALAGVALSIVTATAQASSVEGKVANLSTYASLVDTATVIVDVAPTGQPSCHTHASWHYQFDMTTARGKSGYSTLLTAFATNSKVKIVGTGSCYASGNVEHLKRVELIKD